MTTGGLIALSPLIVIAAATVGVMLLIALDRDHKRTAVLTLASLVVALLALPIAASATTRQVTPLLVVDDYALFYIGLTLAATFAVAALSYSYLENLAGQPEEYYLLLLSATLGACVLIASNHFVSFFLGLEILSVSLYALIGYVRTRQACIEAALKYLILGAASAAALLFGMALIYAELGTMDYAQIAAARPPPGSGDAALLLVGWGLMLVGIGFKLALVPFHLWAPDVYQGAPAPVTAFVSTVSKGAMFALLVRFFAPMNIHAYPSLVVVIAAIAVASMLVGNFSALLQTSVKRLLAFSSIAHLGYLLVAFLASGALAVAAVPFYLVAYFAATLGAFGVVGVRSGPDGDADDLQAYRGLSRRHPWLAAAFTAMLLSLLGIPLTGGFVAKFYVGLAAVQSAVWIPVFVMFLSGALGLFYYMRIVVIMYMRAPADRPITPAASLASRPSGAVLAILTLLVMWLGVFPALFIEIIQTWIAR
ncbi:MAG: NADH-quinone oxidoreductase subunit N [Anaerolineales bacterium]|nr:NADH-quinone oxidoreductase subunit N [Anaerolineales bacterium]